MASFRPLQPAPFDQDQALQPQSRPTLTQKPKRTVTLGACVACRKRKSKCDGQRPICSCCSQKDTECLYELGPNEKPSQAMKRKNEEMQGELSNLRHLYDFLRLRPEQEAQEILRRIRATSLGTTPSQRIQELADYARHGDLLIQPTLKSSYQQTLTLPPLRLALDSPHAESDDFSGSLPSLANGIFSMGHDGPVPQRRRHASDADVSARSDSQGSIHPPTSIEAILQVPSHGAIHDLVDPRLEFAPNWTNVTSDRNMLIHLMSAWYKWEYAYYHFLEWDIFLDDLAHGCKDCCSDLLVNALLASASAQSSTIKDRSKSCSEKMAIQFYKEARRLWEVGEGRASLPRLQAALLLFMVLGKHGRDKVGHVFLLEACRMARELGLFRLGHASAPASQTTSSKKMGKVRCVTAWALFNFQLSMSFTFAFPAVIKKRPPLPLPYDDVPEAEGFFRAECERHVILLECANALGDAEGSPSDVPPNPELIEVFHLRLKSWWEARPASLHTFINFSPENLLSAMQYHVSIIRIAQPLLGQNNVLERLKPYHKHARLITTTSTRELRILLKLNETHHGWACAIPYVLDPIMVCGFGTLGELEKEKTLEAQRESDETYEGLKTCLRALGSLSSYVYYAQPLFRLLSQTCQALGVKLPTEALHTLDQYKSDEWTRHAANMVSSQYVADITQTAQGIEMDTIVSQWEALTISEGGIAPSSHTNVPHQLTSAEVDG
ncbi:hypothetical protein EJ04DRAFT_109897 [Polyplosphaeria fusca]|uniref:Zn(2)-C6 fungal-type domain-containing protein n=1 Tax=Polyplosphaeria fusca TaxID=682080 RepID=A0A9P4QNT3_9PLEO|nr:hypothetical protein EJ04DRAFT_109897 [Polyplosphaeria fusca]